MPLSFLLSFFLSLTTEIENLVQTPHNKNGEGGVVVTAHPPCLRSVKMQLAYLEPQHNRTIASERENTISFFSPSASSFDDEIGKSTPFVRLVVRSKLCEGRQQRKGIEEQML
jgi:hypothetical protein